MRILLQDIQYALRSLRRVPGFTAAALVTLALGIGANTAIFSVIETVLLSPPNFRYLDRLAEVYGVNQKSGEPQREFNSTPSDFLDWRRQSRAFDAMAAWRNWYYSLAGPEGGSDLPESVRGVRVSPVFFSMLGIDFALGRGFDANAETPGQDQVVVLASSLWKRHFGGDPAILGTKVRVDGRPFTVVGVLPADFCFLRPDLELWMPMSVDQDLHTRADRSVMVFGRLAPGVSMAQAESELDAMSAELERTHPETNRGYRTRLMPVYPNRSSDVQNLRLALLILAGAVALVLLIACANLANLFLARNETRRREIAIRAAIGASRARLLRQMLTESLLVAVGGGLAVALAWSSLRALTPLLPRVPAFRALAPAIDARVLAFTLAIAVVTGIVFGLAPAFQGTRQGMLRASSASPRRMFAGRLLMGAELALSIVLLAGAALLVKSLWRLESVEPGFRPDHLLTMQVSLPRTKYPDPASVRNFYREVVSRVDVLPGVSSAVGVNIRPFLNFTVGTLIEVPGRAVRGGETPLVLEHRVATPGYLRTLGIPLVEGRDLAESDGPDSAGVVVVNQLAARQLWPNENPIGKQIRPRFGRSSVPWQPEADPMEQWLTVVGVAANVRESALNEPERAKTYLSAEQFPSAFMFLVVRTAVRPESLAGAIRKEVLAVDHDQPVSDIRTMDSAIRESATPPRLSASLLTWFGAIAVLLAAAGVYGVMSYVTGRRAQEIAIRMAVGACPADILAMILREIGWIGMVAAGVGSITSAWAARALKSLLFQVAPEDPLVFAGAAIALVGVALAASILPARKAARVDPAVALRNTA